MRKKYFRQKLLPYPHRSARERSPERSPVSQKKRSRNKRGLWQRT